MICIKCCHGGLKFGGQQTTTRRAATTTSAATTSPNKPCQQIFPTSEQQQQQILTFEHQQKQLTSPTTTTTTKIPTITVSNSPGRLSRRSSSLCGQYLEESFAAHPALTQVLEGVAGGSGNNKQFLDQQKTTKNITTTTVPGEKNKGDRIINHWKKLHLETKKVWLSPT